MGEGNLGSPSSLRVSEVAWSEGMRARKRTQRSPIKSCPAAVLFTGIAVVHAPIQNAGKENRCADHEGCRRPGQLR